MHIAMIEVMAFKIFVYTPFPKMRD